MYETAHAVYRNRISLSDGNASGENAPLSSCLGIPPIIAARFTREKSSPQVASTASAAYVMARCPQSNGVAEHAAHSGLYGAPDAEPPRKPQNCAFKLGLSLSGSTC
eukprot:Amastigsp_a7794_26.p4 type:complete len:107 gc:universal Amastigsp_a7794_26:574-254(-)